MKIKFFDSTHNFYRKSNKNFDYDNENFKLEKYNENTEIEDLEVVKNEEFGFFLSVYLEENSYLTINKDLDLPWWGVSNKHNISKRYRIEINSDMDSQFSENIFPRLVDYVKDDNEIEVADIILNEKSKEYPKGEVPIFIQGIIPKEFDGENVTLNIKIFENNGYEKEIVLKEEKFVIKVKDYVLENEDFFLDLWQHPCSWARVYNMEYFSEEHFIVIENYLKELRKLGQKVINLVVSDFPWAGQKCFDVVKNASRLYEYNIIKVFRKNGKLILDFKNLDKYIEICYKLGIDKEINLFGLIGNWHGYDFGSPLSDYADPIRVSVYDEDEKVFDYIRKKEELKEYINLIFKYFEKKGYLEKTKVIGDEPGSNDKFLEYSKFLKSCTDVNIEFKYALHSPQFFEDYEGDLESFSVNTLLLGDYYKDGELISEKYRQNSHKMTWYSCCFPKTFNIFVESPLIESRLTGIYTYLFNMKGMLRWAYGIYVEDIYSDITYKQEKWTAGDMFFVYPGKNMKPVHSLREKNMLYGIQDFNLLRQIEDDIKSADEKFVTEKQNNNCLNNNRLRDELKEKLLIKTLIKTKNENIELDKYFNISFYKKIINNYLGV